MIPYIKIETIFLEIRMEQRRLLKESFKMKQ